MEPRFVPLTDRLASPGAVRLALAGVVLLSMGLQARVVFTDDGINWPDEIYQSFEPAHRLVYGYALMPWEFLEGARTWAVPGFVAFWLTLFKWLGLSSPDFSVRAVKMIFVALSGLTTLGVARLARVFGVSAWPSVVAAMTSALCALTLYFAPRAMSENLSAPLVVWGLALTIDASSARRLRLLGASLLGLATIVRLQNAVVCVAALLILAVARRGLRVVAESAGVMAAWALVLGLFDAAAWHHLPSAKAGGLFHSVVVYWRFNIVENRGAGWGTAPFSYFFRHLFLTMPGVTVLLAVSLVGSLRRAWALWVVGVLFFALHAAVAHKELRFVLPVMPVLFASCGVVLSVLPTRLARVGAVALVVATLVSALQHRALTMGDVGSYPERAQASAWDDFGPVNRLMLAASRQPDVCGLRIDAAHLAWTGGSTYLHHPAPLYMPGYPPERGFFNYVITGAGSGMPVVAREGALELIKIREGCVTDPGYSWRLP